ncbi:unnamed protein product [Ceutorhynchus assimilis]|uniref:Exostosin-2 n=1 Tax=Ceutorhynchus assimilis TaxID=467358 RepID=A0A9N9MSU0_9CUCU|nr:unnamed protein product [Ceutorhynchus assimilis]
MVFLNNLSRHSEWRKLAKKLRRKRIRQAKALERDQRLLVERQRIEKLPQYKSWLQEQERLEQEKEKEAEVQRAQREKQWQLVEIEAQKQWQELQKKIALAREEKMKQNMKIKLEWEKEQQRLKKIKEAKEKELEEKRIHQENREKVLLDFLEQGGNTPEHLNTKMESNPGKPECPFFQKVSACRFFDACSRNHIRPGVSKALLITNFFTDISLRIKENEHGSDSGLEFEKEDTYTNYKEFFFDVVMEMEKCGKIKNFFTCCNHEAHLRGNVYIQFKTTRDALLSYHKFNGRWYAGRQLNVEFCTIENWNSAICGLFFRNKCPKGNSCNFLHIFDNPNGLYMHVEPKSSQRRGRNGEKSTSRRKHDVEDSWDQEPSEKRNWRWSESPERIPKHLESNEDCPHTKRRKSEYKSNSELSSRRSNRHRSRSGSRKNRSTRKRRSKSRSSSSTGHRKSRSLKQKRGQLQEIKLQPSDNVGRPRNPKCNHWDCFNIYRCGHTGHDRIAVYVYPLEKYLDENGKTAFEGVSKEYYDLLKGIVDSKYYTANPNEACVFIPFLDTLNEERIDVNLSSRILNQLPQWSNGENHIIFNMISGQAPDFSTVPDLQIESAMIAGASFDTYTFRQKFDISIPVFSPVAKFAEVKSIHHSRTWKIISSQLNIDPYYLEELQHLNKLHQDQILILNHCHHKKYTKRCEVNNLENVYHYPQVLKESTFCLIFRGHRMGQFILLEAMAANCIPVIVMDGHVMPFHDVIDWRRVAIFIMESHLNTLLDVINDISEKKIVQMRKSVMFIYNTYFSSMEKIAISTLDIIQDRVYPHQARIYDELNLLPSEVNLNPLYFPTTAPRSIGFTAVILTYDRVQSLYTLIERLAKVPSLMKIVVVWNNQNKNPPSISQFPKISKVINVIKTKANKLSNRFYPYKEIETEAVLHIDDDIVMLTADEVEFAFEVWREFPDRIVGFPSRTHLWDNVTNSWKYESEWLNEISMVLTGAAFLHKYWSYLYTNNLPSNIKDWVDDNMNCEDIAMNFLVANVTNKPPMKVTPRKKFKCPECTNNEMLSADIGHMVARSQCVDRFAKIFGRMPLKSVEFRADPVLFKDAFPEKLKRFNNIGSL